MSPKLDMRRPRSGARFPPGRYRLDERRLGSERLYFLQGRLAGGILNIDEHDRAPSSANRMAIASPMPAPTPVMMAVLPCNRKWGGSRPASAEGANRAPHA